MITTISIKSDELKKVDELLASDGYKSRSDVFRTGLRALLETKQEKLEGETKCVLIMAHKKEKEEALTKIKHVFEDLIETQVHTHLADGRCTELFVLAGDGAQINELVRDFRRNGAEKLVLIPS